MIGSMAETNGSAEELPQCQSSVSYNCLRTPLPYQVLAVMWKSGAPSCCWIAQHELCSSYMVVPVGLVPCSSHAFSAAALQLVQTFKPVIAEPAPLLLQLQAFRYSGPYSPVHLLCHWQYTCLAHR